MSKKQLIFIIVSLAVVLVVVLLFCGVQYERYLRIYKAVMTATNNPEELLFLQPGTPTANPASLLIHGVYGAQQFAKKRTSELTLPPPMVPVLLTDDAGIVIATDETTPSLLYILFRGTLFDYEWKKDFDFIQTPAVTGPRVGMVHKGFQNMFLSYYPYILKCMTQYQPSEVHVAGHSLGAALSLLTTYSLANKGLKMSCFTFAPPKLGNAEFAAAFSSLPNVSLTQYVNEADVVPFIPLSVMPNPWVPKKPLYYEHIQQDSMVLFSVNNKSWQNNHSLLLHMTVVDQQTPVKTPA
jgi:hypothetical protein